MGGIAVAYLHRHDNVNATFHSCEGLLFQAHPEYWRIESSSSPRLATARNGLVRDMLTSTDAEWLFMVDDDMAFPAEHVERLKAVADPVMRPIVGGLAFVIGRKGIIEPTIKRLNPDEGGLSVVWDYPGWDNPTEAGLCKADATGAACILIHRNVLVALEEKYGDTPHPWFADSVFGGVEWGEDVTFCIRARQLGFPIWIDTSVEFGHVKPWVYKSDDYRRNRAEIDAMGGNEFTDHYLERTGFVETGRATITAPTGGSSGMRMAGIPGDVSQAETVAFPNRAERRALARSR